MLVYDPNSDSGGQSSSLTIYSATNALLLDVEGDLTRISAGGTTLAAAIEQIERALSGRCA